jgi:hypothetical protein
MGLKQVSIEDDATGKQIHELLTSAGYKNYVVAGVTDQGQGICLTQQPDEKMGMVIMSLMAMMIPDLFLSLYARMFGGYLQEVAEAVTQEPTPPDASFTAKGTFH